MITLEQYFQGKPHTAEHEKNAADLLARRQALRADFWLARPGHGVDIDPDTGTEISGSKDGKGDGGFRMEEATTGRKLSSHKEGRGVDDSDQDNAFDAWLSIYDVDDGVKNSMLERHGLYREHPSTTPSWCHLTTRPPPSGRRTFYP